MKGIGLFHRPALKRERLSDGPAPVGKCRQWRTFPRGARHGEQVRACADFPLDRPPTP